MAEKSSCPTPTMMRERGRLEAAIMARFVSSMSQMIPSVMISRTK